MTGLLDRPDATTAGTDPGGDPAALDDLAGRPVVTLGGDDAAAIAEPIREGDAIVGFTLEKRSLFGGPLDATLPRERVLAFGPDAIVIPDESALERGDDEVLVVDLCVGSEDVDAAAPAVSPALVSTARHLAVVAADDGTQVGRVDRFVIDPTTRTIGSLRLDHVASDVRFVSWREVVEFGDDRVTISSAAVLRRPDGDREDGCRREFRATGKPVLSDDGRELGELADVEFDREDGRLTALVLRDGDRLDGTRVRGLGPYAVVVRA